MIALFPPADLADELAVAGGLTPPRLHLTLADCGPAAGIDSDALIKAAAAVAARAPIEAVICGHARFTLGAGEQASDVYVALVDSPELEQLRREVMTALEEHGITVSRGHGFMPHLTLIYLDREAPEPMHRLPSRLVTFPGISAVHQTDRHDLRFTGPVGLSTRPAPGDATVRPPSRAALNPDSRPCTPEPSPFAERSPHELQARARK